MVEVLRCVGCFGFVTWQGTQEITSFIKSDFAFFVILIAEKKHWCGEEHFSGQLKSNPLFWLICAGYSTLKEHKKYQTQGEMRQSYLLCSLVFLCRAQHVSKLRLPDILCFHHLNDIHHTCILQLIQGRICLLHLGFEGHDELESASWFCIWKRAWWLVLHSIWCCMGCDVLVHCSSFLLVCNWPLFCPIHPIYQTLQVCTSYSPHSHRQISPFHHNSFWAHLPPTLILHVPSERGVSHTCCKVPIGPSGILMQLTNLSCPLPLSQCLAANRSPQPRYTQKMSWPLNVVFSWYLWASIFQSLLELQPEVLRQPTCAFQTDFFRTKKSLELLGLWALSTAGAVHLFLSICHCSSSQQQRQVSMQAIRLWIELPWWRPSVS